jgi:hypothetical protein
MPDGPWLTKTFRVKRRCGKVNQTVQRKLSGWMKMNKSNHWSVGCKIVQWRVNTQFHSTLKDTPSMYHKYPSTMFVDSYQTSLEMAAEEIEYHAVSPRSKNLCNKAATNMTKTSLVFIPIWGATKLIPKLERHSKRGPHIGMGIPISVWGLIPNRDIPIPVWYLFQFGE